MDRYLYLITLKDRRLVSLALIIFLLAGTAVGWAAIGQNTFKHGYGGVMPSFNATDYGYYVGVNQIVSNSRDATFSSVTDEGLTSGRVPVAGVGGLLGDDGDLTFSGDTLTATKIDSSEYYLGTDNKTDIFKYPQQPASYIIWKDGSTYYAKNGTTASIDHSGTNAYTVIQSALDDMNKTQFNGILFIRSGLYTISQTITIPNKMDSLIIMGEGPYNHGTSLVLANNVNDDMFEYAGGSEGGMFLSFRDLHMDGEKAHQTAGSGIKISAAGLDGFIFHCFIEDFEDYCIQLGDGWNWKVMSSTIEYAGNAGIYIANKDTKLIGNKFIYNEIGIKINDGYPIVEGNFIYLNNYYGIDARRTEGLVIQGNVFHSNNEAEAASRADIYLYDGCRHTSITGNTFDGGTQCVYGVRLATASETDTVISGNTFRRHTTAAILDNGVRTKISSNPGFVTENAGNATLAAISSRVQVSHGCDYTPTLGDIQVTANRDLGNCTYFWIGNITSPHFYIYTGASGAEKNIDKNVYFLWSVNHH